MRTVSVNINGKEYPAAFTVRVLAELEDRSGGMPATEALSGLLTSGHVRDAAWMLAQLLSAGARLADAPAPPPDEDALLDLVDGDDAFRLCADVLAELRGFEPRVRLEETGDDGKNARAAS